MTAHPLRDPVAAPALPRVIDAVVSHHLNPYRSGAARFNQELAVRLEVPLRGLDAWTPKAGEHSLLSFKVSEFDEGAREALEQRLGGVTPHGFSLFLHDWCGSPLERRMVGLASRVLCGNDEIVASLSDLAPHAERLWAPGLLGDCRPFEPAEISVFSFGMAHKLRVDMFARLRELLESSPRSWALYISNANHETVSERDAESVYEQMREVYPRGLYFLGNLSDVAVYNELVSTTFFAAFFRGGARANNTSVASAMEHGAVVITNLDEHSPPELGHGDNVLDITRLDALPTDPLVLRRLSVRAIETARELSWDRLIDRVREAR